MTRRGKIARLPHDIRDEINSRLHDGEEGVSIVAWLNSHPEVRSVLAELFDSRPINEVNLTEWKQGGYRDWVLRQDVLEFVDDRRAENIFGEEALGETAGASLVQWVALHYSASAKAIITDEADPKIKWARLREICTDVALLHRVQLTSKRVAQEEYWMNRQQSKDEGERNEKLRRAELFAETVKAHRERWKAEAAAKAALPAQEKEE